MKCTETAGGIVMNGNMVLVANQHGDSWSLPKGHIDRGETKLEAAIREIREETGIIQLDFVKELGSYARHKIGKGGKGDDKSELKTIHMLLFTTKQKELMPLDPDNPEAKWVHRDKVAGLLTHPKDREFYLSVLKGI